MENFHVKADNFVPAIDFNAETGVLNISGESYHEYTLEFYQPAFDWLNRFLAAPGRNIQLNFRMTYYNTSTSRRFLEMFDLLEVYEKEQQGSVEVNWYYNASDVDMKESGEEYQEDTDLTVKLIAV
jgi:hypothetical protein